MDDPLVPQSMGFWSKALYYGSFGSTILMLLVTAIVCVVEGIRNTYHHGYVAVALALFGLLLSVTALIKWVHDGGMEDKVKYLTIFQCVVLMLLCISVLVVVYEPELVCSTCPVCIQNCILDTQYPAPTVGDCSNAQYDIKNPLCFTSPAAVNYSICVFSGPH